MPENLIDFKDYLKEMEAAALQPKPHECKPESKAEVLLLTCMDFRFFLRISEEMQGIRYDHVILAGAALGAVVYAKEKTWKPTFFDHLGLARKLHCIEEVWVFEHRGCGAYGPDPGFGVLLPPFDRERERQVHQDQVNILRSKLPSDLGFHACLLEVPTPSAPVICDQLA